MAVEPQMLTQYHSIITTENTFIIITHCDINKGITLSRGTHIDIYYCITHNAQRADSPLGSSTMMAMMKKTMPRMISLEATWKRISSIIPVMNKTV